MPNKVKVVLRPGANVRIGDVDYGPGDTIEVDPATDTLLERGLADREGDTKSGADDADEPATPAKARRSGS